MKIVIYLLLLAVLVSCNQKPAPSSSPIVEGQSTTKAIGHNLSEEPEKLNSPEDIRLKYNTVISKVNKEVMDSASFKYDCKGEKSGTITCFSEDGELRMLRHSYAEYSHHEATDQYFVKDSTLFFVYFKRLSWSFDSDAPETGGTKDNIAEKRFYIVDGKPVKCLEKKYVIRSYIKENPQPDAVANKEVRCGSLQPVEKEYGKLLSFVRNGGKGCPGD